MPLTHLARSAAISDFAEVARAIGLDPIRMVDEAGIPRAALSNPDLTISAGAVVRLFEAAAERAGVEDLGLRIASRRKLSNLGAFGLLVREQPNVRKAIDAVIEYGWIQNEGVSLRIDEAGGLVILNATVTAALPAASRQSTELMLAILVLSLRTLLGENWRPQLVCFSHIAPANRQPHARLFNCPVEFDHDFSGIVLARRDLELPIPRSDPSAARQLEKIIDSAAGRRRTSADEAVRHLVLELLPTGQCTAMQVALRLGIDRRTLHRHLAEHKTSFSDILDDERGRLAQSHIAQGGRSLSDVAVLLGFSCLSSFSRWYARKFGQSATSLRRLSRPDNSPEARPR